ncbi:MAG: hypothetical protein KDD37_00450 [Bdellovibrionales bacterium]|nr:hypothetical protein [Bdellovibrionales bacterium]
MAISKSTASHTYNISYDYWLRTPDKEPHHLYLLLHGFSQRGESIFKKLEPVLPQNAAVLSINAPFPSPVKIKEEYKEAYAWYFYLSKEKRFVIPPTESARSIHKLLTSLGLINLPVHIIGFSQGGYMVPWLVREFPKVTRAITIAADYPNHYYEGLPAYQFDAVHGVDDKVAPIEEVKRNIESLVASGRSVSLHEVSNTGHEVNDLMIGKIRELVEA